MARETMPGDPLQRRTVRGRELPRTIPTPNGDFDSFFQGATPMDFTNPELLPVTVQEDLMVTDAQWGTRNSAHPAPLPNHVRLKYEMLRADRKIRVAQWEIRSGQAVEFKSSRKLGPRKKPPYTKPASVYFPPVSCETDAKSSKSARMRLNALHAGTEGDPTCGVSRNVLGLLSFSEDKEAR